MQQPARPAGQDRASARSRAGSPADAQLVALDARREELKSQLQSLTDRRAMLSAQMEDAQGAAQRDLQARIATLDQRTARLDNELNGVDDAINAAIAQGATRESGFDQLIRGAFTQTAPRREGLFNRGSDDGITTILAGQGIGFVLLGLVLWRGLRRRVASGIARLAPDDANRIAQLQSAVDVMAVEIERISEGQRYVAKVLNERLALGEGPAAQLPVRRGDAEPARSGDGHG